VRRFWQIDILFTWVLVARVAGIDAASCLPWEASCCSKMTRCGGWFGSVRHFDYVGWVTYGLWTAAPSRPNVLFWGGLAQPGV